MYRKCILICICLSTHIIRVAVSDETIDFTKELPQTETYINEQTVTVDLDELEAKVDDIWKRSNTTPDDIIRETHVPTWKKWLMRAGDLVYWTYETSITTVQTLCSKCKDIVTG